MMAHWLAIALVVLSIPCLGIAFLAFAFAGSGGNATAESAMKAVRRWGGIGIVLLLIGVVGLT
jgi:hypothetical protein